MSRLRTNWPLVITAALTSTLIAGAAHARGGGGHGSVISRPITSMSHMATTPSPRIGLSAVHPPSGLPGGGGAMRSPFPVTTTPPAIGGRSQSMQRPAGSSSSAGRTGALLNSGIGTIPTPPPPGVLPPSAIAAPSAELPPIPPLSPQLPTQFSTGGVVQPNMALSPGVSASPSESAPSAPGGGGKSLADCMGFWDRETHMTKAEWKAACVRTMQEYPTVLP